jgi:hypothetical protein
MRVPRSLIGLGVVLSVATCRGDNDVAYSLLDCADHLAEGPRSIASQRDHRFLGKVQENTARCRGGDSAVAARDVPWVDWSNYFGTNDSASRGWFGLRKWRGVNGALIDLEYQRVELIRFNLFDNAGTYSKYAAPGGTTLKRWDEMRLPPAHPNYRDVGGAAKEQLCRGELIRGRTLTGICNDIRNPLMGSAGMPFARNVEFETTFPEESRNDTVRNRHGNRLALLTPDPQVVSRKLFTRVQSDSAACADGLGKPGFDKSANCDYKKAPFFNVLAAFWIQFMTHDWFSHMREGRNGPEFMKVGCTSQKVNGAETPLSPADQARLRCRPGDAIDRIPVGDSSPPPRSNGRLARAPRTFRNTNTAWWDASQLYGFDSTSRRRVKRDPADSARLLMVVPAGATTGGDRQGYLPTLDPGDPMLPDWAGQEAAAFPDNWTIGMSFYHNVFAREHNQFVDQFRKRAGESPDEDSGLRNPAAPNRVIRYADVTPDELFEAARLVVSAEIAKIHTIEWTTQLLYDEPLFRGMNSNWNGLIHEDNGVSRALARVVGRLGESGDRKKSNDWYAVLAAGPGIFGLGSDRKDWSLANPDHVNGGVNHFGSPFNFPEEFVTVYRLHALVPDLLEYRRLGQPNAISQKVPVVETFRGKATGAMHERGLANWALSMGRQRLGALALQNHPRFLQNLSMGRLKTPTGKIDVAALDLIRDRERGVPRFNEFRRQYGLRQLTSFDDFISRRPMSASERADQQRLVDTLRAVYGQHRCDAKKIITTSQLGADQKPINDCFGRPDGTMVDNVEDLDVVVGWLAETTRPHGFAISETQFMVFILNASRRLFSDRFFTSSFRPEFYTTLGVDWVRNNGPEKAVEERPVNGHKNQPVSPLKRVLLRTIPELEPELKHVVDAFDPWARDRGEYYSLAWRPRPGAEADESFQDGK